MEEDWRYATGPSSAEQMKKKFQDALDKSKKGLEKSKKNFEKTQKRLGIYGLFCLNF